MFASGKDGQMAYRWPFRRHSVHRFQRAIRPGTHVPHTNRPQKPLHSQKITLTRHILTPHVPSRGNRTIYIEDISRLISAIHQYTPHGNYVHMEAHVPGLSYCFHGHSSEADESAVAEKQPYKETPFLTFFRHDLAQYWKNGDWEMSKAKALDATMAERNVEMKLRRIRGDGLRDKKGRCIGNGEGREDSETTMTLLLVDMQLMGHLKSLMCGFELEDYKINE
ncbi:hypothetical protein LXL04_009554 [Taraxacum kok-saghyz]